MKIQYRFLLIFILLLQGCDKNNLQKKVEVPITTNIVEKFCFLKDIEKENSKHYATIDFIDYLKNSDMDSTISQNQKIELPNGYGYVNKEIKSEKIEITDSVKIILQTFSYNTDGNFNFNQSVELNVLEEALQKNKNNIFLQFPYKIKIAGNKIVALTEIYIP